MSDEAALRAERARLDAEILALVAEQPWRFDDARFDALARRLFAFQFAACEAYARYARARDVTPERVSSWRDVPAVPTGAFKEVELRCFPADRTVATFRTSGTSAEKRGALHLDTLALYEASLLATIDTLFLPDLRAQGTSPVIRVLAPSAEEVPDSSLSHMFAVMLAARGAAGSGFDVVGGELRVDPLLRAVERAAHDGRPVALCGTAFAFVHLLDALAARDRRLACPPGSRIMETGGFKGRSREVSRDALHTALSDRLGVPASHVVNQYGMTELGSQFYDSLLADPSGPRRKLGPPWARVRVIDAETGREAEPGEVGMLVVHDLVNTGSIAAVETADLGRQVKAAAGERAGFEILGREPGAEARGCSIAADAMLGAGFR